MANTNWENLPSTNTPINDENLNKISAGIVNIGTSVDSSYRTNILHSKNLWHFDKSSTLLGITTTFSNSEVILNGTTTGTGDTFTLTQTNVVLPAGTYTIKTSYLSGDYTLNSKDLALYLRKSDGTLLATIYGLADNGKTSKTTTITLNETTTLYVRNYTNGNGVVCSNLKFSIQLNEGSSALPYEPFINNSINVNGDKFTETIGIGTNADSSKRFNVLKGEQLYNSSNVELGKTWQGNANNNRARLVLPISPNETYNIKVKGSGVQVAIVETAETPTSSTSSIVSYTYNSLPVNARYKAQSTTKYVTLQLDAGTTFTQAILNSLQISIFYGDCSIVVDNEEIYSKPMWEDKTSEITINDSNINGDRTKLFVNESLRLVFLQVFYASNVANTTIVRPIQYPYKYRPAFVENDRLWFPMIPSNGGPQTARATLKSTTEHGTYVDILCTPNTSPNPFGFIIYPF